MYRYVSLFFLSILMSLFSVCVLAGSEVIGIIGSEQEELKPFIDALSPKKGESFKGYQFLESKVKDHKVVLVKAGIGKVNAAAAATLLIEEYEPEYLFIVGTCGALQEGIKHRDLIVSTKAAFHDFDLTDFGYRYGQVPGFPQQFKASKKILKLARSMYPLRDQKDPIHYGLIVSGDSFIGKSHKRELLLEQFPQALAADMEAASIGQIAHIFKIPFVAIKSVSDDAKADAKEQYEGNATAASETASRFVLKLIEKM